MSGKSVDHQFVDWEKWVFGYGYGTGEQYILPALKTFMAAIGRQDLPNGYDFDILEQAMSPAVAWLLINALCRADAIEYGSSPRYGWLSGEGIQLRDYLRSKTVDELLKLFDELPDEYAPCQPACCNCGPNGYQHGVRCKNIFWV